MTLAVPVRLALRQLGGGQVDHDPILGTQEARVDDRALDTMRAFLDGRFGKSHQHRLRNRTRRDVDFHFNRQRFDPEQRKRIQLCQHSRTPSLEDTLL